MDQSIREKAIELHRINKGKIGLQVKTPIKSRSDLSLAYTPGVGEVSKRIAENKNEVWALTARGNMVAVVSDGSAVLGLGNIGPEAALPVMEGKAVLFKEFGGVDAFPLVLVTQDTEEIIKIVKAIAPTFGGINLEDISAPRCFEIEKRLNDELDIPVFHDDQHGTAIAVLAGLINALKLTGRSFSDSRFVILGAGAAGIAVAHILISQGVRNLLLVDSKGIVSRGRGGLHISKTEVIGAVLPSEKTGDLIDALVDVDVLIGVSAPGIVTKEMIESMNTYPIVFALANPIPEIMPELAHAGGAKIVATGRSDYPNQINNVLAFPGLFRGLLDSGGKKITPQMKLAVANALAEYVKMPSEIQIIPDPLDRDVARVVADAITSEANR